VIQVLEEAGLRPDLVVGTSAGSLVAVLYASGRTGAQLQQVAEGMDEAAFTDWTLPLFNRGVLKGEALARYDGPPADDVTLMLLEWSQDAVHATTPTTTDPPATEGC